MTGCEISTWLFYHADFCEWFCGCGIYSDYFACYKCKHDLAYDMYIIAVDMLETM